ncbi:acyl-CoA reductase [Niabella terrae]
MDLKTRQALLLQLGDYLRTNGPEWQTVKENASIKNPWFLPEFIDLAVSGILDHFLVPEKLEQWLQQYPRIGRPETAAKQVGIVMAGNIPLVGFHDFLCVLLSGHQTWIKTSSKDEVLLPHLVAKLTAWAPELSQQLQFAELLKNCDAYIATGSNSSAGHFEYYFRNHPHIIRKNRTSVAVLDGQESEKELAALADDVYQYFGLGCRNITKIYVPEAYDFIPLLTAFNKYNYLADHHKYKNNYDYNLALHILNHKQYMSNPSLILVEEPAIFSPVSQLHYTYYTDRPALIAELKNRSDIQCMAGRDLLPFGKAQQPELNDYADGVDTMRWLELLDSESGQSQKAVTAD